MGRPCQGRIERVVAHFGQTSTTKGTKVHEGKSENKRRSWHFVAGRVYECNNDGCKHKKSGARISPTRAPAPRTRRPVPGDSGWLRNQFSISPRLCRSLNFPSTSPRLGHLEDRVAGERGPSFGDHFNYAGGGAFGYGGRDFGTGS